MSFAPLIAEIEIREGYVSLKITRDGKFVSATTHANEALARSWAKKKRAQVLPKQNDSGTVTA